MLVFRPHEKNLFHQTRSWMSEGAGGQYVIQKAATNETYQARWQVADQRPELLQDGRWLPTFERAKQVCEQDATLRLRARIAARARQAPKR